MLTPSFRGFVQKTPNSIPISLIFRGLMENPRFLASVYFHLGIVALVYKSAYSLFSRVCTKNPYPDYTP
jgi:hypothetical protein